MVNNERVSPMTRPQLFTAGVVLGIVLMAIAACLDTYFTGRTLRYHPHRETEMQRFSATPEQRKP